MKLKTHLNLCEHTKVDLLAAAEGDEKKLRKFSMTAYNGGVLEFGVPIVVDLSTLKVSAKPRPILRDHNPAQIVGHTERVDVANSIRLSGSLSGGQHAAEVIEAADNGFPWQASIGASVGRYVEVEAGQKVTVNGREFKGPLYVAKNATLKEVSFVALGADDNTSARMAAAGFSGEHEIEVQAMGFEAWLEAMGLSLDGLKEDAVAKLKAKYEAEMKAEAAESEEDDDEKPDLQGSAGGTLATIAEQRKLQAAESKRIDNIRAICGKGHGKIEAEAIEKGWDVTKTELEVLRAGYPKGPAPGSTATGGDLNSSLDWQIRAAALQVTAGIPTEIIAKGFAADKREQIMNAATSAKFRGLGIKDMLDATIRAAGLAYSGSTKSNEWIETALQADRMLKASGFSTVGLSGILGDTANKALLEGYTAVETVWQMIFAVRSNSDFKVSSRYRLDATGAFKKVGATGELKSIGLSEASYTNQLDTYGALVALSRQMIINDDLGAFLELPRQLGRMSSLRIEEAVFVLLLSNPGSFFGTGNKNYFDGASSALGVDSLSLGKTKFRDQVDGNGKPILVSPKVLLTPTTLEHTAYVLLNEQRLIDGTATTKQPSMNPHAGTLKPATSTYLNNTGVKDQDGKAITGQSDDAWYLFSDPASRAAGGVAFLNGQQRPTIESTETPPNTLGMQWRAFSDFGVGLEDPKAAVKSLGTNA